MTTYKGSFCGPYWSDGEYQTSVAGKATAQSEFDATCKEHDRAYANSKGPHSLDKADDKFVNSNLGKGILRSVAALAVKANKGLRIHGPNLRGSGQQLGVPEPSGAPRLRGTHRVGKAKSGSRETPEDKSIIHKKNIITNKTMTNKNKQSGANAKRGSVAAAYSKTVGIKAANIGFANGRTIIRHREYLAPIRGSTTFRVQSMSLNPGLSNTFPWLSNLAANYEQYKVNKLHVEFVTSSGSTASGRVGLAFGYNPSEGIPVNKQEFFSIVPNREEAPWEDITLAVPVTGNVKYIRLAGVSSSGTLNTYDMGQIFVAASGTVDSTSVVGDLFVNYEIELLRPHYGRIKSEWLDITSPSSGSPMGTAFVVDSGQALVTRVSATTLEFSTSGDFQLAYFGTGATTAPTTSVFTITPISGSLIVQEDIDLIIDNGATQFGLTHLIKLRNVQVGDRLAWIGTNWGQTSGGMTITSMSQH